MEDEHDGVRPDNQQAFGRASDDHDALVWEAPDGARNPRGIVQRETSPSVEAQVPTTRRERGFASSTAAQALGKFRRHLRVRDAGAHGRDPRVRLSRRGDERRLVRRERFAADLLSQRRDFGLLRTAGRFPCLDGCALLDRQRFELVALSRRLAHAPTLPAPGTLVQVRRPRHGFL